VPLAERMRPTALTDLVGQDEVVGPGKALAALIEADRVPNMILWGYVARHLHQDAMPLTG
jgi:putative ATPase